MDNLLKEVRENWMILCFIVTVIISWTNLNSKLVQAQSDIENLKQALNQIYEMKATLEGIKTDITYIKKAVYK